METAPRKVVKRTETEKKKRRYLFGKAWISISQKFKVYHFNQNQAGTYSKNTRYYSYENYRIHHIAELVHATAIKLGQMIVVCIKLRKKKCMA